jgi:hypothetical protein
MSIITVHIEADTGDGVLIRELGELFRRLHGRECGCQQQEAGQAYHETTTVERAERLEKEQAAFIRADGLEVHPVFEGSGAFGVTAFDAADVPPPPPASPFGTEDMGSLPPPPGWSNELEPTAVELDVEGLPWDARIHSSSKAKLAKTGAWKLARGCPPELAVTVLAELKAAMALPRVGTPPTAVSTLPIPPAPSQLTTTDILMTTPPVVPVSPVILPLPNVMNMGGVEAPFPFDPTPAAPLPVAAPPGAPTTFPAFLVAITQQQAAKKLTFDEVLAVLKENGLENIQLLTARPDLIPQIYNRLEALWTSR